MTGNTLINNCFLHDKDRLRHDEALDLLEQRLVAVTGVETLSLSSALGRITASPVDAPHNIPLHTNSAVDGYAYAHLDRKTGTVPVSNRIAAGDLDPSALKPGTAVRIFTGAPMPAGADTVAMQEDCKEQDGQVSLPTSLRQGANCRLAGEDLKSGDSIVSGGRKLYPADLAALASIGKSEISAHKKLRVIYFSSGNEMRRAGANEQPLRAGEVYDANWPLLCALMKNLPVELSDGGVLGDSKGDVTAAIAKASEKHDVILTTGGASRGTEDYMLTVLDQLGKRHLWQLAVKPGRPMMFGQITRPASGTNGDCLFFGLPGNPVAAMVCFLLYTRPALLRLAGAGWETPPRFPLPARFEVIGKKPDRREFLRGVLCHDTDGKISINKFPRDGSGLISSLREADGLIELPEEMTTLQKGELVDFIPFSAFD